MRSLFKPIRYSAEQHSHWERRCPHRHIGSAISSGATLVLTLTIFLSSLPAPATAQSGGGFFDKDFAKDGFFTEESPEPAASPTAAPSTTPIPAATPTPAPVADPALRKQEIADKILGGTKDIIDQTRGISTNPDQRKDMNSAVQGIRELLNQKIRGTTQPPAPPAPAVGELTVINTSEEYEKEISLGRVPTRPQISVVIAANPRASFLRTLDRLLFAATKRNARLKSVYIIGMNRDSLNMQPIDEGELRNVAALLREEGYKTEEVQNFISTALESVPSSQILLDKLGFVQTRRFGDGAKLLEEKRIRISPTWIVEGEVETRLFEGAYDPTEFLDERGFLLSELPDETRHGTSFGKLEKEDGMLMQYDIAKEDIETRSPDMRAMKDCTRPRTRRFLVGPASLGVMNFFDVLIYKTEHLDRYPEIATYSRGKLEINPELSAEELLRKEPIISFIQTLPVRCLPTRFRQINDGSRQYMEFLQGEAAIHSP